VFEDRETQERARLTNLREVDECDLKIREQKELEEAKFWEQRRVEEEQETQQILEEENKKKEQISEASISDISEDEKRKEQIPEAGISDSSEDENLKEDAKLQKEEVEEVEEFVSARQLKKGDTVIINVSIFTNVKFCRSFTN